MSNRTLMLGNEAMALALIENGCRASDSTSITERVIRKRRSAGW